MQANEAIVRVDAFLSNIFLIWLNTRQINEELLCWL